MTETLKAETLKAALDGWFGSMLFWGVLFYAACAFFLPRSCERPCSNCPWGRSVQHHRWYWELRVHLVSLAVFLDAGFVVLCFGRVTCDLVLGEVAWTLPIFAAVGAYLFWTGLQDLRELDRVRARREELRS